MLEQVWKRVFRFLCLLFSKFDLCKDILHTHEGGNMNKVLIASRDIVMERMLNVTLTINGFSVVVTKSLQEARNIMANGKIDIFLLDTQLDPFHNKDLILKMREERIYVPVLFLGDKIKGLEKCEFLETPFDFPSLKFRMNQMFRKQHSLPEKIIVYGDLYIDVSKKVVTIKEKMLNLGMEELAILISLARKTGRIVGKELMHSDLEAQGFFFNTTIQHHLWGLKKKLHEVAGDTFQIKQVLGEGFRLMHGK